MKNLDTIDVEYGEETFDDGSIVEYITLILNGEPVKGTFDSFTFACSGEFKQAELELMTCSCGVSGCAGIFYGTRVKRRRYTTEWRDIDCGFPKKFYSFDNAAYERAIEKTIHFMRDLAMKRETEGLRKDDEYRYESLFRFASLEELGWALENTKYWLHEQNI